MSFALCILMIKRIFVGLVVTLLVFVSRISDVFGYQNPTLNMLKKRTRRHAEEIFRAVNAESARHGLDPLLLFAIIESESRFGIRKRGRHGEIGLMQLKPSTARWIARKNFVPWRGSRTLENPSVNIRLGAYYLSHLREEFDGQQRFYVSAYNMGAANVRRALANKILPRDYVSRVMKNYQRICYEMGLGEAQRAPTL